MCPVELKAKRRVLWYASAGLKPNRTRAGAAQRAVVALLVEQRNALKLPPAGAAEAAASAAAPAASAEAAAIAAALVLRNGRCHNV